MTYSQVEKAIPIYNLIHSLEFELKSLSLLRRSLEKSCTFSLAFRVQDGLDVTIAGLEGSYGLDVISSIIDYKREQKKLLESNLKLID